VPAASEPSRRLIAFKSLPPGCGSPGSSIPRSAYDSVNRLRATLLILHLPDLMVVPKLIAAAKSVNGVRDSRQGERGKIHFRLPAPAHRRTFPVSCSKRMTCIEMTANGPTRHAASHPPLTDVIRPRRRHVPTPWRRPPAAPLGQGAAGFAVTSPNASRPRLGVSRPWRSPAFPSFDVSAWMAFRSRQNAARDL